MFGINPLMMTPVGGGLRPQDVFAVNTWTGNGSTQTIANGIDLAGSGGLVWAKSRSVSFDHGLFDTLRGPGRALISNSTTGEGAYFSGREVTSFNSNGYDLGLEYNVSVNSSGYTYVGWSFRRATKFFDVVTYTGNGVAGRQVAHSLGVAPGMVVIKCLNTNESWTVFHRSLGAASNNYLTLSSSGAAASGEPMWNATDPSSSVLTLGTQNRVNRNGYTYVAYLWAHDPDPSGIVQCGTATGTYNDPGVFISEVSLPWKPQYLMLKCASASGDWFILDSARNWPASAPYTLKANSSSSEDTNLWTGPASSNGFSIQTYSGNPGTYIYLAIREPIL